MKRVSLASMPSTPRGRAYIFSQVLTQNRLASSTNASPESGSGNKTTDAADATKRKESLDKLKKTHKTMAKLDDEMKQAMEGLSGDGGAAGAELEGGKPVAMKRAVRENMFRYI